jgi:hypothetical protein
VKKIIILSLLLMLVGQANSSEKTVIDNTVVIKGDKQALELSDIPLSQYQFDDISFFTKNFEPQKELFSLLEEPDILMQLDNKELALDFDNPYSKNSER